MSYTDIGIPAQQQVTIFEAFEQDAGKQEAQFGVTELGQAITSRLVELMAGYRGHFRIAF